LFSKKALANIANFDETADLLFKFIQGTTLNTLKQEGFNLGAANDYGKKTVKIHSKEAVPKLQFWNSNLKISSFARLKA
jgi:hypothetical protein